ncbi:MAG: heavy metal translocating P-type ATPase [Gemmatimonadales bacterium]|nr:heavy metal translocating P-type ATPase [Gemmatimonadales bacterium]
MASRLIQVKASGLMCSFCTMSVEKALGRLPGVHSVQVNLVHGIILVDADPARVTQTDVSRRVEDLGYTVVATEAQQVETDEAIFGTIKRRGFLAMGVAVADLALDPLNLLRVDPRARAILSGLLAVAVLLWIGSPILRKTLMALRQRVVNANVLLSTGAWGAFAIGVAHLVAPTVWPDFFPVAIWLMALHLFFGYFKLGTRKRAAESVRRLLALQVNEARVVRGGREVEVPVAEVGRGETIVIRPGERVPLDGRIRKGRSSFDCSSVTGESMPVYREASEGHEDGPGAGVRSEVIGGTISLDGIVWVEVTRPASEGYVAQVVGLMRQIEEKKPPIQLLMDRLMNYYGPVVYAVASLAFAGWWLATGSLPQATLIGLTTIIMGYPCALGITTPMVLAIGGGHGIARGLLVRAGEFFQALAGVDTVVWDKTGTITYGRPTLREVLVFRGDETDALALIAAAESGSEHPLAGAIVRYAEFHEIRAPEATTFQAVPGQGVVATVAERRVLVGRRGWLEAEGIAMPEVALSRARMLERTHTVVYAAADGELLAALALQDLPRPGAADAVQDLARLGVRSVLLTGDSRAVAEAVAAEIGIAEVHAEVLPHQKAEVVHALQAAGRRVAMVGDGINDGPALMQSDVGIALGAGTDVAMESAGVVLVSDRLDKVAAALRLGRASHRKMRHNIAIAVFANLSGMTLAVAGAITVPIAIGIMSASVAAVLLSTLSLIRLDLGGTKEGVGGSTANVVETVIPARRIHCPTCTARIEEHLGRSRGVRKVVADVIRKEVLVVYEPSAVSEDALRGQLEELGYR